jgi:hypothetical protein
MRIPALLVAATMSLAAQDATSIGGRVQCLLPVGDLRNLTNSQVGLGAAAFMSIPMGSGIILRPLVGAQFIPKGDNLGLAGTKTTVTSLDLMLDALWFPDDDSERGAYLVGSAGIQQWRVNSTGTTPSTFSASRLGLAGGVGYQFTPRLGAEAKVFWSPVQPNLTSTGLMLGVTVKL